jgi:hypothetical protein
MANKRRPPPHSKRLSATGEVPPSRPEEPQDMELALPDPVTESSTPATDPLPCDALGLATLLSQRNAAATEWLVHELRPRLLYLASQRRTLGDPEDLVSEFLLERCLEGNLPARMKTAFEEKPGGGAPRVLGYLSRSFTNWLNDRKRRQVATTLSLEAVYDEPVAAQDPEADEAAAQARRGLSLIAFACETWFANLHDSISQGTLSKRRRSILLLVARIELFEHLARAERREKAKASAARFPRRRPAGLSWSEWIGLLLPWNQDEQSLPVEPGLDLEGAWERTGAFIDNQERKPSREELARLVGGPSANALDKRLCYARQALGLPPGLFPAQASVDQRPA